MTLFHSDLQPLGEAAKKDCGGPSLSTQWIATSLFTSIPNQGNIVLLDRPEALRSNVTRATKALDKAIFWLGKPSDQTILLALYYIDILVYMGFVCIPGLGTTHGIKIMCYVRRVFTVGVILAEFRLSRQYPGRSTKRCARAFQGEEFEMSRIVRGWGMALTSTSRFWVTTERLRDWVMLIKRTHFLTQADLPTFGFMNDTVESAFNAVMEKVLPPPPTVTKTKLTDTVDDDESVTMV